MKEITVTYDEQLTRQYGTDPETKRVIARIYRCIRGDLEYRAAITVELAERARVSGFDMESRAQTLAEIHAKNAFAEHDGRPKQESVHERQRRMNEYRRQMAEWTEARARGELPPHPVRPHMPG